MKIIDFEKKGNLVRFYLGNDDCTDYWGDDWNDAPYDCNAEKVYDEYVTGYVDIVFPFDYMVLEPCNGVLNTRFAKEDMKDRNIPCIIALPYDVYKDRYWQDSFEVWVGSKNIVKFYFEDNMDCYENESMVVWGDRILEG